MDDGESDHPEAGSLFLNSLGRIIYYYYIKMFS